MEVLPKRSLDRPMTSAELQGDKPQDLGGKSPTFPAHDLFLTFTASLDPWSEGLG